MIFVEFSVDAPLFFSSSRNCFDPDRAIVPRLLMSSSFVIPMPVSCWTVQMKMQIEILKDKIARRFLRNCVWWFRIINCYLFYIRRRSLQRLQQLLANSLCLLVLFYYSYFGLQVPHRFHIELQWVLCLQVMECLLWFRFKCIVDKENHRFMLP